MSFYLNILFALLLLWITVWFFRKDFKVFFINGLIVFQAFTLIPSLIYIETGKMISEQGREGFFVGSVYYFGLFYLLTLIFIYLTFNTLRPVKLRTFYFTHQGKNIEVPVLLVLVITVLGILIYNASQSPSPLFDEGITRFNYWEHAKYPVLNKLFGNTAMFIPFALGLLFPRIKKTSLFILAVYFAYNFYIGQKFSPIVNGTFAFLLPLAVRYDNKIFLKTLFNKKSIVLMVLLGLAMYKIIYDRYERRYPFAVIKIYDPNEAMFYRIFGLQGHLFWGATERFVYHDKSPSWNLGYLPYGMHEMMKEFAVGGEEFVLQSARQGFNFTNAYPSILFMIFPPLIAYLFHVLIVIFILSLSGWILMRLIKNKSFVLAVISFQFFNWTIYALTMGYFYKLIFGLIFNFLILLMGAYFERKKIYA